MEPLKANLSLSTNNPQAEFTIIDKDLKRVVAQGRGLQHELLIGDYEITATANDYLPLTRTINLKANRYEKLDFNLQTYQGSLQQKRSFWKRICCGLFTAVNGAAVYYSLDQYNQYYDQYKSGRNQASVMSAKDKTKKWDDLYQLTSISISVPALYTAYSFIRTKF